MNATPPPSDRFIRSRAHRTAPWICALGFALSGFAASGCTPASLVVGAGARLGLAAFDERGIGGTLSDTSLQLAVNSALLDDRGSLFWAISTLVRDRQVLLVGNVATAADKAEAVRRAQSVDGVVAVVDALEIGPRPVLNDDAQDTIISRRLESDLLFDSEIKAINYGILTHNGVVHLMGTARGQWELDRVIAHARNVPYVRGVMDHVRVLDDDGATTTATN